jgi:integrase
MARRDAGEGAIYWNRSHNYWVGELIVGKNPETGRNIMRTCRSRLRGRAGEKVVEEKLREIREGVADEVRLAANDADPGTYTLWGCILDWHAFVPTTGKTSQQTADRLRDICKYWVHPDIQHPDGRRDEALLARLRSVGDMPLVQLDAVLLVEYMRTIAPFTSRLLMADILSTIRRSIRYHMQQRNPLVDRNVANDVDVPKPGRGPGEPTFLTKDQVELAIDAAEGTRMHALVMIGFMLGLRPGEIRALRWEAIDFGTGLVDIVSYARKTGDTGRMKTGLSRRSLKAPRRLLAALQAHQESFNGHEHVFTDEAGKQLTKDGLRWRVGQVFKAAGLPAHDPYTMRHTFASIADDQGIPHRKIADMMGHRDITTFQRVYRHKLRPEVTDTADLMDGIWGDE